MTPPAEKRAEPTLGIDRLLAERDRLKAANVELANALEGLSLELARWLTTADAGLPAVIKTLGDCADVHTAHRKAFAVLKAHGLAEEPTS